MIVICNMSEEWTITFCATFSSWTKMATVSSLSSRSHLSLDTADKKISNLISSRICIFSLYIWKRAIFIFGLCREQVQCVRCKFSSKSRDFPPPKIKIGCLYSRERGWEGDSQRAMKTKRLK
jgi:hypothetical protein